MVGEHPLKQSGRLAQAPRRPVGAREGIAGGECEGVVVSQNARMVGEHPLKQGGRLAQAPRCLVGTREVDPGNEGVGMIGPQNAHTVGEHPLVQGDGLIETALLPVGAREVVAGNEGVGMIGPQDTHTVSDHLLEQGDGLVKTALLLVGDCKVATGGEGVGAVGSQDTHTVSNHFLEQRDRLTEAAHHSVGDCEVVAGAKHIRMVVSPNARTVGERLLVQGDGLVKAARRTVGLRDGVRPFQCHFVRGDRAQRGLRLVETPRRRQPAHQHEPALRGLGFGVQPLGARDPCGIGVSAGDVANLPQGVFKELQTHRSDATFVVGPEFDGLAQCAPQRHDRLRITRRERREGVLHLPQQVEGGDPRLGQARQPPGQAAHFILLHPHQRDPAVVAPIGRAELVGVEPVDQEVDHQGQGLPPRVLDLEREPGERLRQVVVGPAPVEELRENRRDRFEPAPFGQIADGFGHAALVGADPFGDVLDWQWPIRCGELSDDEALKGRQARQLLLVIRGEVVEAAQEQSGEVAQLLDCERAAEQRPQAGLPTGQVGDRVDARERATAGKALRQFRVVGFPCQGREHLARLFGGEGFEADRVEEAEEWRRMGGEAAVQASGAADDEDSRLGLEEVAQLLLPHLPEGVKDLVDVFHEHQDGTVLAAGGPEPRVELGLVGALHPGIRCHPFQNRGEQPRVGHDRPRVLGQPRDAQGFAAIGARPVLGTVVDQGNEVRLARAARADEERVVGAGRGPQITDPLHERFQDRLAHHEQASEQVLRHGRGGET